MLAVLNVRTLAVGAIVLAMFALITVNVLAKEKGDTRPGWGHGDKNHEHTGPPGQSVRPGHDNDDDQGDDDDQGHHKDHESKSEKHHNHG